MPTELTINACYHYYHYAPLTASPRSCLPWGGAGGGGGDRQVYHPSMLLCRGMIKRASYWEGAKVQQAALMANFGDQILPKY